LIGGFAGRDLEQFRWMMKETLAAHLASLLPDLQRLQLKSLSLAFVEQSLRLLNEICVDS